MMNKKEMNKTFKFIRENIDEIQLSSFSPVIPTGVDAEGWEINEPSGVVVFTFVYVKQPLKVKIKVVPALPDIDTSDIPMPKCKPPNKGEQ
jgi:hypothetical protein